MKKIISICLSIIIFVSCIPFSANAFFDSDENSDNIDTALCSHSDTVNVVKTEPTCFERGFESGIYCNDCNTYISGHEKIPASNNHSVQQKSTAGYTYYQCDVCEKYFTDMSGQTEVSAAKVESDIVKLTSAVVDRGSLYGNSIKWIFYNDGTLVLEGYGQMRFGDSVYSIPQYEGYKEIIKKVIICDGIRRIALYSFIDYPTLETVVLGNTISEIYGSAFSYCVKLSKINFPESLELINDNFSNNDPGVFEGCISLKDVYLNEGLKKIGDKVFRKSSIENLYLPDSLQTIGEGAFVQCSYIENLFIPKSVKTVESFAFYYCKNLQQIIFDDAASLEYMSQQVFDGTIFFETPSNWKNDILYLDTILIQAGHTNKSDPYHVRDFNPVNNNLVIIPNEVTMLAENSFWMCNKMVNIKLSDSLLVICDGSFYRCSNLIEIVFPEKLTYIGEDAFYKCEALKKVDFHENCMLQRIGSCAFVDCFGITEITFPDHIRYIESSAFSSCTGLTEITLPDSITSINWGAFSNCTELASIKLPDNIYLEIYDDTFGNTAWYNNQADGIVYLNNVCLGVKGEISLKQLDLFDGTKIIANRAFSQFSEIEEISFPDSLTHIGGNAFYGCVGIEKLIFPESLTYIDKYAFYGCKGLKELIFPEKLSKIGDLAFSNCSNLSDITFSDSITEIGTSAFSLTEWSENQEGTIYIGDIFYGYSGFKNKQLVLKSGTTAIVGEALYHYYSWNNPSRIKSVFIPDTVTKIGQDAFLQCLQLNDVYYSGNKKEWEQITIDSGNIYLTSATLHYNHTHTYECTEIKIANCVESGMRVDTCTECGVTETEVLVDANNHSYGNWTIKKPATVIEEGLEERVCSLCGKKESRMIEKLDYYSGDANGDGKVNAADARIVLRISAQLEKVDKYSQPFEAFDVNGDGKINASDARKVLRISAKLES